MQKPRLLNALIVFGVAFILLKVVIADPKPPCDNTKENFPVPNLKCGTASNCPDPTPVPGGEEEQVQCVGYGIVQKDITWNYCAGNGTPSTRCEDNPEVEYACTAKCFCKLDEVEIPNPDFDPEDPESPEDIFIPICVKGEEYDGNSDSNEGMSVECKDQTKLPTVPEVGDPNGF